MTDPAPRVLVPGAAAPSPEHAEVVVLLDARGRPTGTWPKSEVHHASTPLHLAFSCHVVAPDGRVLVGRRAAGKATWPATWSNACCGHPAPGETLREAVTRRLGRELGLAPRRMGLALPDFTYRAASPTGVVEHELCPVVVAEVTGEPAPRQDEVDDVAWISWEELCDRVRRAPASLSPWSVAQVTRLAPLAPDPLTWLDTRAGGPVGAGPIGLDRPVVVAPVAQASPLVPAEPGEAPAAPGAAAPAGPDADPIAVVRPRVERVIRGFLDERSAELGDLHPAAARMGGAVRDLIDAGGKRLRPAFVYWGHRATGADHDDGVLVAAAALELLHTFALIHDDVMDRSERRRGAPTAHVVLAGAHRADGLDGDDGWFGTSGAVLAGDLAFLWAGDLLDSAPLAPDALGRARRVFTRLCTEVIGGQYLDLRLTHGAHDADALARQVALLKSARYTVTRPLQLGAALAGPVGADGGTDGGADGGADGDAARLRAALAAYGDAVGLAFQLRDDVLGLFGDPEVTGKSRLDDLREGKHTLLVVRALELATPHDRRVLAGALGDPDLDESDAARCRRVVADSGALASVEALIDARHGEALAAVAGVDGPAHDALVALAALSTCRER